MKKLVWGVGVNDLPYRTEVKEWVTENGGKRIRKTVFRCKYYESWRNMLERCHSKKFLESNPSYIGTSVCSDWLYATEFKKWMEQQDWSGKCLDKDIILPGNKLYSLTHALLFCKQQTSLLLHAMRVEEIALSVYVFINKQVNIKPVVETLSSERMNT